MKLLFVHSHKFKHYKGLFYSEGQLPYELFQSRYLTNFEKVIICARKEEKYSLENWSLSSGEHIEHISLPDLSIIKDRNKKVKETNSILKRELVNSDVLVARMPSVHGYLAIKLALRLNKPYVVEVVGDVFDSLWNHGSIYGKVLAPLSYAKHKRMLRKSKYTIYVTDRYLQDRYPSNKKALTINASNVELSPTDKECVERRLQKIEDTNDNRPIKIGLIGSYASKYKGIDTGIKLVKKLNEKGVNCQLNVLGSGSNEWLISLADKLNIKDKIHFDGILSGQEAVSKWLDDKDIYIQPSLTEGLPRALIEAMSRGLPAVGSRVGGIPELLSQDYLHNPGSLEELFDIVNLFIKNKELMKTESKKNYSKSQEYTTDVLMKRRDDFWKEFIKREVT